MDLIVQRINEVIVRVASSTQIVGDDILVDGSFVIKGKGAFDIYSDVEVPKDIEGRYYCYNPEDGFYVNDNFLFSSGKNKVNVEKEKVILVDEHTGTKSYNLTQYGSSISIVNDSEDEDLVLSIDSFNITVKAQEQFTDDFELFDSFTITTAGFYRVAVRG